MTKQRRRKIANGLIALLIIASLLIIIIKYFSYQKKDPPQTMNVFLLTEENYGEEINQIASSMNLPASYFKALIVLESSGLKNVSPRFEPHVYEKLKAVKNGTLESYEHVTKEDLADATDAALRNLASSWGPFQLMGYKCMLMEIKIADIRGTKSVFWGMKWINMTYGDYLRERKFNDAFHIHNTGKPFPRNGKSKTYHPYYVDHGLQYMKKFEELP